MRTNQPPRDRPAPRLLLFDLDGTLIDSRRDLATGINLMRADYGLPPLSVEEVAGHVGDGIRKLVERSLHGHPVDLDEAVGRCAAHYGRHMTEATTLYPGVREGLRGLRAAGFVLGLLSNKPGPACRRLMEHFGLADLLAVILGGGDTPRLKPHPEPLHEAMRRAGATPAETWMIGDHMADLQAARHAGTHRVFLTYGIGTAGPETPEYSFDSFAEMAAFFLWKGC